MKDVYTGRQPHGLVGAFGSDGGGSSGSGDDSCSGSGAGWIKLLLANDANVPGGRGITHQKHAIIV